MSHFSRFPSPAGSSRLSAERHGAAGELNVWMHRRTAAFALFVRFVDNNKKNQPHLLPNTGVQNKASALCVFHCDSHSVPCLLSPVSAAVEEEEAF